MGDTLMQPIKCEKVLAVEGKDEVNYVVQRINGING
jgi:hypothetical protein